MEDFRHKAKLVIGGHMTEAPATITYASVVSRETVRIALTITSLNDLEVKLGDILNAMNRHLLQKRCGPLWVLSLARMLVRLQQLLEHYMALNQQEQLLKVTLPNAWTLRRYASSKANPDLWLKQKIRPDDRVQYYSYHS